MTSVTIFTLRPKDDYLVASSTIGLPETGEECQVDDTPFEGSDEENDPELLLLSRDTPDSSQLHGS